MAGGFAIGLFAGLVPGPLQMLTAALLAVPLKKNLPVALVTTLYTNPFTIAPLYLLAYAYGRLLLGAGNHPAEVQPYDWDWAHWIDSMRALARLDARARARRSRVGLVALALTLAAAGYFAVQFAWRAYVILAWRARRSPPNASRPMISLNPTSFPVRAYFAFRYPLLIFVLVEIVGSLGFWVVSGYKRLAARLRLHDLHHGGHHRLRRDHRPDAQPGGPRVPDGDRHASASPT